MEHQMNGIDSSEDEDLIQLDPDKLIEAKKDDPELMGMAVSARNYQARDFWHLLKVPNF